MLTPLLGPWHYLLFEFSASASAVRQFVVCRSFDCSLHDVRLLRLMFSPLAQGQRVVILGCFGEFVRVAELLLSKVLLTV